MDHLSRALRLEVSSDAMEARLSALTPRVWAGLSLEQLHDYLARYQVVHGILEDELAQFLHAWKRGMGPTQHTVARGSVPEAATNRGLRRLQPPARNGQDPVELLPLFVKQGDPLFVREGQDNSRPGHDVHGRPFAHVVNEDAPELQPGVGIVVDGRVWRAEVTGFLEILGDAVYVVPRLIHRHDLPAARYRWSGDAELMGTISAGTRLSIGGNLVIIGDVGANVQISVGGDLTIHGRVEGGHTTRLEAAGSVELGEIQHTSVLAGGDVMLEGPCVGCHVRTRGQFTCDGNSGHVFGGHIQAVRGASVGEVFAEDKSVCRIHAGQAAWVRQHAREIDQEVERWKIYSQGIVDDFENRYGPLLRDRARIYRLPDDQRQLFECDRARATAEQGRVDQRIAELRNFKERILDGKLVDSRAVIRVRRAVRGSLFGIGSLSYTVRDPSMGPVVLHGSRRSQRILPIPESIYDSSDMVEREPQATEAT